MCDGFNTHTVTRMRTKTAELVGGYDQRSVITDGHLDRSLLRHDPIVPTIELPDIQGLALTSEMAGVQDPT